METDTTERYFSQGLQSRAKLVPSSEAKGAGHLGHSAWGLRQSGVLDSSPYLSPFLYSIFYEAEGILPVLVFHGSLRPA